MVCPTLCTLCAAHRYDYSDEDLAFLVINDTDSFNKWEAGQQLAQRQVVHTVQSSAIGYLKVTPEYHLYLMNYCISS